MNKKDFLIKAHKWYKKRKIKEKEYAKKYREKNKQKLAMKRKKYYENNKEKIKLYIKNNENKIREYKRKYHIKKMRNDTKYKLILNLRIRIHHALKRNSKSKSTMKLLGCTIPQLKQHLQQRFKPEMDWSNYGTYWEIDHIKPCSAFDLNKKSEQYKCFHYSNLQPLRKTENRKKKDNYGT